jgi:two-component system, OmpR family, sensor kinase
VPIRLARITDDLLVLARGDEDKLVVEPELTDIHVLLARSAERASSRAAVAGLICRVEALAGLAVGGAGLGRPGQAALLPRWGW